MIYLQKSPVLLFQLPQMQQENRAAQFLVGDVNSTAMLVMSTPRETSSEVVEGMVFGQATIWSALVSIKNHLYWL